jgi:aminopeptidase-like protein
MHRFIAELFPICRSITGEGLRETLRRIQARIPLTLHEVPTWTPALDWTVPREWNIREAWIAGPDGKRVVDFRDHTLHVLNYSVPFRGRLPLAELLPHLYTLPGQPDLIPYRTSYYKENWGFCLSHRTLERLAEGEYEVCIDSSLEPGNLSYGEYLVPGQTGEEVLVSCHACHPSLANDNLSGVAVATTLAALLSGQRLRYSYRFLFIPGTIGSLVWLSRNEATLDRIAHGFVVTGLGAPGIRTYKRSRRGNAPIDRAFAEVLRHSGLSHQLVDFSPYGYDERQYCSPGFNLPVGCFMGTPHGTYPEYHTSADNLTFVRPEALLDSLTLCWSVVRLLEHDRVLQNLQPKGEPQLGRRGLYRPVAGQQDTQQRELAMLWVLNLSDGSHSLLDIAERSGLDFETVRAAALALEEAELLRDVGAVAKPDGPAGSPGRR